MQPNNERNNDRSDNIQRRFHLLEQAIGQAAEASSAEPQLPSELRDSIQRVDRLGDTARDILQTGDPARIRKLLADMTTSAERARRVCTNLPQLSAQIRGAVSHMVSQIQELKRDLQ
ncbi:phage shock protein A [Duganella sp. 3397]|uniref:Uncharacterized protein n=1 Tax=Duganella phyllosphaerae TaxID=762836 RepID=A0A1E7WDT8_9BURK|nr:MULTISPECIES: hypothetical protein [Duganella]MDR7050775.1 phage shock protein A [Duganella sp. 3397]OEZ96232.1 hypothetical protein DUPY_40110 [Duganella phyllosphaerae]